MSSEIKNRISKLRLQYGNSTCPNCTILYHYDDSGRYAKGTEWRIVYSSNEENLWPKLKEYIRGGCINGYGRFSAFKNESDIAKLDKMPIEKLISEIEIVKEGDIPFSYTR